MALTAKERTAVRALASAGNDNDLSVSDRRTRGAVVDDRPLTPGQEIEIDDGMAVEVLGPGRGARWFMAGWKEGSVLCVGQFRAAQITRIDGVVAARLRG